MPNNTSEEIVISLCDLTGNFVKPWADVGYECFCVDLQHSIRQPKKVGNINFVWGDARSWIPPHKKIKFFAAFPPCTNVAVSGARDFKTKGVNMLCDALELFNACLMFGHYSGAPFMVENPVSVISSYIRKPDYTFDPCDYAGYKGGELEDYTKKTCLWTGNGFVMPPVDKVEPKQGSKMHLMPPSEDRANLRSATPMGFAQAVFEANSKRELIDLGAIMNGQ
jgi:hypothetical protein